MDRTKTTWVGQTLANGRYRVDELLDQGGMALVYKARDLNLDLDVVIKTPRPILVDDDSGIVTRFEHREVKAMVQLIQPHVVTILDAGRHQGVPYLVAQYLAGGSLEDKIKKSEPGWHLPMPLSQLAAKRWLRIVAETLDAIHSKGFVHRDVKPANILFDQTGEVFLSDFGIAKAFSGGARGTLVSSLGTVLGTPEYIAPEVVRAQQVDGRADQYSLAIMVHELLCGRRPFEAPEASALMVAHATELPPKLAAEVPSIPVSVSDAVWKALSKNPDDRFGDCASFCGELMRTIGGKETIAWDGYTTPIEPPTPVIEPPLPTPSELAPPIELEPNRTGVSPMETGSRPTSEKRRMPKRFLVVLGCVFLLTVLVHLLGLPTAITHRESGDTTRGGNNGQVSPSSAPKKTKDALRDYLPQLDWPHIDYVGVKHYTVESIGHRSIDIEREYDLTAQHKNAEWSLEELTRYSNDQPVASCFWPDLNDDQLNDLITAVEELKIQGASRKPDSLARQLAKDGEGFITDDAVRTDLQNHGFYLARTRKNKYELLSNNGEVLIGTKEAVEYLLRFGTTLAGSADNEAGEGKNRYLFVSAHLNLSKLPTLEQEKVKKAKEKVAEANTRLSEWYYMVPQAESDRLFANLFDLITDREPVSTSDLPEEIRTVAELVARDEYELALEAAQSLLDDGFQHNALYELAGTAAFATHDFDKAKHYLAAVREDDFGSPAAKRLIHEVDDYKRLWRTEQELRRKEAAADDLPRVRLRTTKGDIVVELFENEAPDTVGNFVRLVEQGFYDGLSFHCVLGGFGAQGGCAGADGTGGPGYNIYCESYGDDYRKHFRGTLAMAHAGRDTGGSQFFIAFRPIPHLNGKHTAFGRVIEGMEVLKKLQRIDPDADGSKPEADKIIKAEVVRRRDHEYRPNRVK